MRSQSCVAFLILFFLSACTSPPTDSSFPDITYAHLPELRLKVAHVEIVNRYQPPAAPPHVDHLLPISLTATALAWGRDRLHAVGGNVRARVILHRASMTEIPLETGKGIRGLFTIDQSEKYEGVLEMSVEIVDEDDNARASVKSTARRSRSVSEVSTQQNRQEVWFRITDQLMSDINRSLEDQIRTHLEAWLAS